MLERRDIYRYKTRLRSTYKLESSSEEKVYSCACQDISTKGAKLLLSEPLPLNAAINIELNLPRFLVPIIIRAQVVWQEENNAGDFILYPTGIYFIRIKDRDRTNIIDFLKESFPEEVLKQWWNGTES